MVSFLFSYALLAILPGPNFVVVSRAAWGGSRATSLATALGVALGAAGLSLVSGLLFGISSDTGGLPAGQVASTIFGGLLILMALRVLPEALGTPVPPDRGGGRGGGFFAGLLTAGTNPVSAAFFAASALRIGSAGDLGESLGLAGCVLAVAGVWSGFVAVALTQPRFTAIRIRLARPMAVLAAAVLMWNGLSMLSALHLG